MAATFGSMGLTTVLLIDTPSPFAPIEELRAFLHEWENSQYRDHPDAQNAIREVRGYLAMREDKAGSSKGGKG